MLPGDLLLIHGNTLAGKLLRLGQWLCGRPSYWDHVAVYVGASTLVEATARGIRSVSESFYIRDERITPYAIHLPQSVTVEDRAQATRFVLSQVGHRYGWLDCLGMLTARMTPIVFGLDETETCSSLAARALECCGIVWETDPRRVTPGMIAERFGVPQ